MDKVQFDEWFGKVTYGSLDTITISYHDKDKGQYLFTTFIVDNDNDEIAVCTTDGYDQIVDIPANIIPIHTAVLQQSTYLLPDYEDEKRVYAIKMKMIGDVQEPHFQEVCVYGKEELKDILMETIYANVSESHLIFNEVDIDKNVKPFTPRFMIPYLRHLNKPKTLLHFDIPKYGYLMNILVGQEDYKFIDFICELTSIIGCEHLIKNEIEDAERHIEKLTKRIDRLKESIKVANENKNKITNNQYDNRTEGEI